MDYLTNLKLEIKEVEDNIDSSDCIKATQHLRKVYYHIGNAGDAEIFLYEVSHAVYCNENDCIETCKLLKKIRNHTLEENHHCGIVILYKWLLRLHVYNCPEICLSLNQTCQLRRCERLRETLNNRDAQSA